MHATEIIVVLFVYWKWHSNSYVCVAHAYDGIVAHAYDGINVVAIMIPKIIPFFSFCFFS